MKKITRIKLLLCTFLIVGITYPMAAAPKTVDSKLINATVYFRGAELTHSVTAALIKGENELLVKGLSPNVDKNSLRISTSSGVLVSSYEFSTDFLTKSENPDLVTKKWLDSLEVCTDELLGINDDLAIIGKVMQLLDANKNINSSATKEVKIGDVIQMTDYYKAKSTELLKDQRQLKKKKDILERSISRLKAQISQESIKNNKTESILKLQLMSSAVTTGEIKIIYYTEKASWTPFYDINVAATNKPIKIASKAKVGQTTGLDWAKVKLTLSSATPAYGKTAPLFNAWFLDYISRAPSGTMWTDAPLTQNSVSYANKEISSEIRLRGTGKVSDDNQPIYVIDGQVVDADYVGSLDPSMIKDMQVLKDPSSTAIYGSRGANGVILLTLKDSMDDYVTQSDNELSLSFNIDLPYSVPGNGKVQSIDLQTKEVEAAFKYYSVPKLDPEAYLIAEISNWEKLGLLTGKANITYNNTYIGETLIDTKSTQPTLTLTLGADSRISVKREKLQDFSSRKFLGNDVKQVFTYQITVKNNQNQAVGMTTKDQYPMSSRKEIEVEVLHKESTPTSHLNEEVGVLVWDFTLEPGETKTFRNVYSVKYPKDKQINL